MSPATQTGVALVGLRCRTADRTPNGTRGVEFLAEELGDRLGIDARLIGSAPVQPTAASYDEDLRTSRGCLLEAGGQVEDALNQGRMPILLAGDCSIATTTLPAVARASSETKILWLDAHGDFNTPETSPSGYLGGMGLAAAAGRWDAGLTDQEINPENIILCGVRDLDAGERMLLDRSGATVIGAQLETLVFLTNALDGASVYVHLDLDVIDPEHFPAQFPVDSGLPPEKLYDLLEAVAGACEVVGLEVTSFEAPEDDAEARRLAGVAVDAIEPLLPRAHP